MSFNQRVWFSCFMAHIMTAEKCGTEWVMHNAILAEVEVRNSRFLL